MFTVNEIIFAGTAAQKYTTYSNLVERFLTLIVSKNVTTIQLSHKINVCYYLWPEITVDLIEFLDESVTKSNFYLWVLQCRTLNQMYFHICKDVSLDSDMGDLTHSMII